MDQNLDRLPRVIADYIRERRGAVDAEGQFRRVQTVFILRGIQGAGKTTFARLMSNVCGAAGIDFIRCNADAWFYINGVYSWSAAGLEHAHQYAKGQFSYGLVEALDVILVDATNVEYSTYSWYAKAARYHGYKVAYVEWDCGDDWDLMQRAVARSEHVPPHRRDAACRRVLQMFGQGLPPQEQIADPQPLVFQMAFEGRGFDDAARARAERIARGGYQRGQHQPDRVETVQVGVPHARGLQDVEVFQRGAQGGE